MDLCHYRNTAPHDFGAIIGLFYELMRLHYLHLRQWCIWTIRYSSRITIIIILLNSRIWAETKFGFTWFPLDWYWLAIGHKDFRLDTKKMSYRFYYCVLYIILCTMLRNAFLFIFIKVDKIHFSVADYMLGLVIISWFWWYITQRWFNYWVQ